jgi:hypothetical protein
MIRAVNFGKLFYDSVNAGPHAKAPARVIFHINNKFDKN